MSRKKDRVETSFRRGMRFTLIGLLAGILAGLGFAAPIYLVGGADAGAGGVIRGLLIGFPLGGLIGGLIIGFVFQEGLGGLVERAFQGARGKTATDHSWLQSLVIRGLYQEAVEACAREADEAPTDPQPLILGAEVLRDHMKQYETAAQWLRRAQRIPKLTPQQDITITRELVGLYENQLDQPRKALPELARLAERYPGTRAATWATNTLKQIKASVWTDVTGAEADTEPEEREP